MKYITGIFVVIALAITSVADTGDTTRQTTDINALLSELGFVSTLDSSLDSTALAVEPISGSFRDRQAGIQWQYNNIVKNTKTQRAEFDRQLQSLLALLATYLDSSALVAQEVANDDPLDTEVETPVDAAVATNNLSGVEHDPADVLPDEAEPVEAISTLRTDVQTAVFLDSWLERLTALVSELEQFRSDHAPAVAAMEE